MANRKCQRWRGEEIGSGDLQIQNACTPDIIARLEASWRHKLIGEAIADKAQLEKSRSSRAVHGTRERNIILPLLSSTR